jgi:hypothetical protein
MEIPPHIPGPPPLQERQPRSEVFELAPVAERRTLPFVAMDPAFTEDPDDIAVLPARALLRQGAEAMAEKFEDPYELSAFNQVTFATLLHFVLRDEVRRGVAEAMTQPKAWEEIIALQPLRGLKIIDYGSGEEALFGKLLTALGAETYSLISHITSSPNVIEIRNIAQHPELANADIITCSFVFDETNPILSSSGEASGPTIESLLKPGGIFIMSPAPDIPENQPARGMQHIDSEFSTYTASDILDNWSVTRKAVR